jgi:hypothetical protein
MDFGPAYIPAKYVLNTLLITSPHSESSCSSFCHSSHVNYARRSRASCISLRYSPTRHTKHSRSMLRCVSKASSLWAHPLCVAVRTKAPKGNLARISRSAKTTVKDVDFLTLMHRSRNLSIGKELVISSSAERTGLQRGSKGSVNVSQPDYHVIRNGMLMPTFPSCRGPIQRHHRRPRCMAGRQ